MLWLCLDGSSLLDSEGRFRIETAKQAIEGRLHLLPRFRQVLYVPRRGLGGPLWVDAPAFNLERARPRGATSGPGRRGGAATGGRAAATAPFGQVTPAMGDLVPHGPAR